MTEDYKEFIITSERAADGGFVARIRRRDGKSFVVARETKHEATTMQFADESDAMREGRTIANSATMA